MANEQRDLKSYPEFPFIRESWYRFKRKNMLSQEFEEFQNFFDWAIEHGYQEGDFVRRKDLTKPASPENCYIPRIEGMKDICVKGGSKNSPCNGCNNAASQSDCTSYKTCNQYRCWLNKCWEDFREAAKAMGGMEDG